jgi:hypothetical protein
MMFTLNGAVATVPYNGKPLSSLEQIREYIVNNTENWTDYRQPVNVALSSISN